jgi:hypothetical protein
MQKTSPILRWRLFAFKVVNSTAIVLFAGVTSTLAGKEWANMSGTQQLVSACMIATLVCRNLESLLDKSFSEGVDAGGAASVAGGVAKAAVVALGLMQWTCVAAIIAWGLFHLSIQNVQTYNPSRHETFNIQHSTPNP